ncbi:transketolase [Acetobacterium woodii]|uniref:Transketolase, subunit A n=1 Tax=Acetobacterium woodii (strain ATCC 29683 / DSM 1030 / JCM 2381 / KCTC 1655 / WB1) TaxID=931626 RepID=H6LDY8_ACEWD|nr:transketolase [Acetobacterium woodii]AFA48031.1 transketolase, subunit A [Acetobacterium woodii DSM 1030]
MQIESIEKKAFNIREHIINTVINNGDGHAGPSLSCTDILATLYFGVMNVNVDEPKWEQRDRFILSAGHKCLGLYGTLIEKGYEKAEVLKTYNMLESIVPGHPDMKKFTGVDFSSGALGHGLPIGSGMALSAKLKGDKNRVFVLMGDGEQGEGSNWEAAMFASHHGLDNLVGIIDRNGLQINGSTRDVLDTRDLREKYSTFGWSVKVVDGHNIEELLNTFQSIPFQKGKPSMIIANTIKSKGMPFAEGNVKYHHWNPGKDSQESKDATDALEQYAREKGWKL